VRQRSSRRCSRAAARQTSSLLLLALSLGALSCSGSGGQGSTTPDEAVLRGVVYDAATDGAIAGAIVFVRSTGPDFARGRGITAGNEAMDTTDAHGRFRMSFGRLPARTYGVAVASGYSPMALRRIAGDTLNIPLTKLQNDPHVVATSLIGSNLGAGVRRLYLSLLTMRRVGVADSADIVIDVVEDMRPRIIVAGVKAAGVLPVSLRALDPSLDPSALECMAPAGGYQSADTLSVLEGQVLYYLRSRDGSRYGRLQFLPKRLVSAAESADVGGGAVLLWVNINGGRGVCGPDLNVYDQIVGRARVLSGYIEGVPDSLHPSQVIGN
jgi:hypothetical protein